MPKQRPLFPYYIGTLLCVGALLFPLASFSELKFAFGTVLENQVKKSTGTILIVKPKSGSPIRLIVPNATKETNSVVKDLTTGNSIGVWYSTKFKLSQDCFEVWQLSDGLQTIISYKEVLSTGVSVKLFCFFAGVVLMLINLINRATYKRGWIN